MLKLKLKQGWTHNTVHKKLSSECQEKQVGKDEGVALRILEGSCTLHNVLSLHCALEEISQEVDIRPGCFAEIAHKLDGHKNSATNWNQIKYYIILSSNKILLIWLINLNKITLELFNCFSCYLTFSFQFLSIFFHFFFFFYSNY